MPLFTYLVSIAILFVVAVLIPTYADHSLWYRQLMTWMYRLRPWKKTYVTYAAIATGLSIREVLATYYVTNVDRKFNLVYIESVNPRFPYSKWVTVSALLWCPEPGSRPRPVEDKLDAPG